MFTLELYPYNIHVRNVIMQYIFYMFSLSLDSSHVKVLQTEKLYIVHLGLLYL